MRQTRHPHVTVRAAHFERYEERLVFSAILSTEASAAALPDLIGTLPGMITMYPAGATTSSPTGGTSAVAYVRDTYGLTGAGQTVAIIDSGIAYDHVALGGGLGEGYRVVGGWDFTEERDADPYDDAPGGFHGTHVAGIIGSQDAGHPGVSPDVDIVALRVFNDMGLGYTAWVEQALKWVHQHRNDYRFPITTVNLSLGMAWNGSAPPAWGTLEEELAQLAQDGILVTVAAGNSFTTYNLPGLSYPAASQFVVPVASTDANGQLSAFSQRQSRVLAAPGEQIVSTVPDYLYGADGVLNDWVAASGTSMAAPFLAGVSILVREAMTFVGYAAVTPTDIYQHLRNTADTLYDSVTKAHYSRVNLARAIDSLMPEDDYGDTLQDAGQLGHLSESLSASGLLTRTDDRDLFQFTASADGVLSWTVTGSVPVGVTIGSPPAGVLSGQSQGSLRVTAGSTYTLLVSAHDQLARYDLQLALSPDRTVSVDGHVVRVSGTQRDDTIRFWIDNQYHIDVNGQIFSYQRTAPWRFELDGGGGNDRLMLAGSQGSDEVILYARSALMRGHRYELSAAGFSTITAVSGGGPDDVARLFDTAGDDELIATGSGATMRGTGYVNVVSGFERIYASATPGAADVARLYGTAGTDEFLASPDNTVMRGEGYFNKAIGFRRTFAYGTPQGQDVARFYDSAGDDEFVADSQSASMSGEGYDSKAFNFTRTYAYASYGQNDVARLYDSAGNDLFVASADHSYLRGDGFYNKAIGFDRVYAYATAGQDDVARFYDSSANDLFVGGATSSVLRGSDYYNKATQFRRVYAYGGTGGYDVAQLQSSVGAEQILVTGNRQIVRGDGYYTDVRGFAFTYPGSLYSSALNNLTDSLSSVYGPVAPLSTSALNLGAVPAAEGLTTASLYAWTVTAPLLSVLEDALETGSPTLDDQAVKPASEHALPIGCRAQRTPASTPVVPRWSSVGSRSDVATLAPLRCDAPTDLYLLALDELFAGWEAIP